MSGVDTLLHVDASSGATTFIRTQDVEPILEHNKALRAMPQRGDCGRHVAKIPNIIMEKWLHEELDRGNVTLQLYGEEFDRLIERKLADPDWAYLRTDAPAQRLGWIAGRGARS
jgi:hypothetical protein